MNNSKQSNQGTAATPVPFVDLKAQLPQVQNEITARINRVISDTAFILGEDTAGFEKNFSAYIGAPYAAGVASGLDALRLVLTAHDIGPGDEVILPANTFIATALAVTAAGAVPVLCDCNDYYLIDTGLIESKITAKTKAILPVHLYGQCADMDAVRAIAEKHSLFVIEDAAQAHGARYKDQRAGNLSSAGCFSFYPGKNLGAFGDGGLITVQNKEIYQKLLMLRNYGQSKKYYHDTKGVNSRLDTIQAAVLDVKLKYLDAWNHSRNEAAAYYTKCITDAGLPVHTPQISPDSTHIFHLYIIRTPKRDALLSYLTAQNISCGIHYPIPVHLQKCYGNTLGGKGSFPKTESFRPDHPNMRILILRD